MNSSRVCTVAPNGWLLNAEGGPRRRWSVPEHRRHHATPTSRSPLLYLHQLIAVAVSNPDIVYVGHSNSRVFQNRSEMRRHRRLDRTHLPSPHLTTSLLPARLLRLLVEPTNANIVYAGHGGYASGQSVGSSITAGDGGLRQRRQRSLLPWWPVRGICGHPSQALRGSHAGLSREVGLFCQRGTSAPRGSSSRRWPPPACRWRISHGLAAATGCGNGHAAPYPA